jgi:hypothetical protein
MSYQTNRLILAAAALLGGMAVAPSAGIVIRHDRDDAAYLKLAEQFPAVGRLANGGSGTLIAPRWVLTAAHCTMFQETMAFEIGGKSYPVEKWYCHPAAFPGDRRIDGDWDIALLHLAEPVADVEPARLYEAEAASDAEVGKVTTLVGFGRTGGGVEGAIHEAGTKRAGQNVIDAIGGTVGDATWSRNVLLFDFDAPAGAPPHSPEAPAYPNRFGDAEPLDLECGGATGDSGGAAFIDFGEGPRLAGVFSGVSGDRMHVKSGGPDNRYGVYNRLSRVATFTPWLHHVMQTVERPDAAARQEVTISAATGQDGMRRFVLKRTGDLGFPLAVRWTVSGTARQRPLLKEEGMTYDYELLEATSGFVLSDHAFFPAGEDELVIRVSPLEEGGAGGVTLQLIDQDAFFRPAEGGRATIQLGNASGPA